MQQWEYITISSNDILYSEDFDNRGKTGWELVCVVKAGSLMIAYFKRPIEPEPILGSGNTGGDITANACMKCGQVYPLGCTHNCFTSAPIPEHNSRIPKK